MNLKDIPILCILPNVYELFIPVEKTKEKISAPIIPPSLMEIPNSKDNNIEITALKNTIAIQQVAIEHLKRTSHSVANCASIDELYTELDIMGDTETRLLDKEKKEEKVLPIRIEKPIHRRDARRITQEDVLIIREERAAYERIRQQRREGDKSEHRTFKEMGQIINDRLGYNKDCSTYSAYLDGTYPIEGLPTRAQLAKETEPFFNFRSKS